MSRGLRHHGEPAASLQHGPPREPQWICAPRRWQTPNSHQTSSYSDSCCNWGKSAAFYMDFSFKISASPVSVLVTLLKSQQHMCYSRIAKVLKLKCISLCPGPWWSFSCLRSTCFEKKKKTKDEEVAVASPPLITDWLTYISEKFNLLILQLSNRLFLVQGKFVLAFVIWRSVM